MRLILLKEDYGDSILFLTDLSNKQLEIILKQLIVNDENGVGEDITEIFNRFFSDENFLKQLESSEDCMELKELNFKCIVEYSYYGFCEV